MPFAKQNLFKIFSNKNTSFQIVFVYLRIYPMYLRKYIHLLTQWSPSAKQRPTCTGACGQTFCWKVICGSFAQKSLQIDFIYLTIHFHGVALPLLPPEKSKRKHFSLRGKAGENDSLWQIEWESTNSTGKVGRKAKVLEEKKKPKPENSLVKCNIKVHYYLCHLSGHLWSETCLLWPFLRLCLVFH